MMAPYQAAERQRKSTVCTLTIVLLPWHTADVWVVKCVSIEDINSL